MDKLAIYPAAQIPAMAKQAGALVARLNPTTSNNDASVDWDLTGPAGTLLPLFHF